MILLVLKCVVFEIATKLRKCVLITAVCQNPEISNGKAVCGGINMSPLKMSPSRVTLAIGWLVPRTSFAQRTNLGVRRAQVLKVSNSQ